MRSSLQPLAGECACMLIPEHFLRERKVVAFFGLGEFVELNNTRMDFLLIVASLPTHHAKRSPSKKKTKTDRIIVITVPNKIASGVEAPAYKETCQHPFITYVEAST